MGLNLIAHHKPSSRLSGKNSLNISGVLGHRHVSNVLDKSSPVFNLMNLNTVFATDKLGPHGHYLLYTLTNPLLRGIQNTGVTMHRGYEGADGYLGVAHAPHED